MIDTLKDIQAKLTANAYKNEEHVRLSLVSRILSELGWEIWDPKEVDAEFIVSKQDDNTRVDIALRPYNDYPAVFIEIKAVGKLVNLAAVETQLLNYNKYLTAPFTIITDGKDWHFYYSQSGGMMADKKFRKINLLSDEIEDINEVFQNFLSKNEITNKNAESKAREYLTSSSELRAIKDCEAQAEKQTKLPPYPRLPDAILDIMKQRGYNHLTLKKIEDYLAKGLHIEEKQTSVKTVQASVKDVINSDDLPDVRHSSCVGSLNNKQIGNWNDLLVASIKECFENGLTYEKILGTLQVNLRKGKHLDSGFKFLHEHDISYQGMQANYCFRNGNIAAKKFGKKLRLQITWRTQGVFPNQTKEFKIN